LWSERWVVLYKEQDKYCPPIMRDELVIYIPFGQKIMNYALNHWPDSYKSHKNKGDSGPYSYKESVYKELGLD